MPDVLDLKKSTNAPDRKPKLMDVITQNTENKSLMLNDPNLGLLYSNSIKHEIITWEGRINFLGSEISVFIKGDILSLDKEEKMIILEALQNQEAVLTEWEMAYREQLQESGEPAVKLTDHFVCISMKIKKGQLELVFAEK